MEGPATFSSREEPPMTSHPSHRPVSALRARMIEDMRVRGFTEKTRSDYVRNVRAFAAFIRRSPDTATAEDLRRFQLHQTQSGMQPPSINSAVAALRFFFTVTLDRPDLSRRLTVVREPRRLPAVLSVEEVTLLLQAAPGPKYKAALATAYGAGLRVRHLGEAEQMRGEHPAVAGDNAVLFVDQHRVGEAKFADRGGDLRDLLVAVRARVSGVGDQRRAPAPNNRLG